MKHRVRAWLIALVSTGLVPFASLDAVAQEPAPPIHTNKTRFRIPFRFDERELQRIGAREVRLFVSTDAGNRWTVGGTTTPAARRFDFQAPGDGEYWFAVRTVDDRGQLHPPGAINDPALRVVVDTRPPRLDVQLREVQPGRVQLAWRADDPNLDPSRLRLEYREPGDTRWRTVSIVPQASGRTAWSVPRAGTIEVRGVVGDRAENVGRAETSVRVGGGVAPRDPVPDLRQPIAEGEWPESEQPRTADRRDLFIGDDPSRRPSILGNRYDDPDPHVTRPVEETPAERGWPDAAPANARVVNTRRFSIDYELTDVGPSGVGEVEFFITTDDGRKWWRYGTDEDLRSPFSVTVPRDGVYGFTLRATNGVGLADDPPQPGEKPAIVIAVDRTAPEAALTGIEQGRGQALDRMLIRWAVREANPAEKSVALSYAAEGAEDRWLPITSWMADAGQYVWQMPEDGPSKFLLRLSVRDAAGNVTHVKTDRPVVVDLAPPSARIVDVQPEGAER